jgi:hypothetical protein
MRDLSTLEARPHLKATDAEPSRSQKSGDPVESTSLEQRFLLERFYEPL